MKYVIVLERMIHIIKMQYCMKIMISAEYIFKKYDTSYI